MTLLSLNKVSLSPKQEFARSYLSKLCDLINTVDIQIIEDIIDVLVETGDRDGSIYFIGNGGSAATAIHYANDIRIGTRRNGARPLRAISLADNLSIITAIANDEGYENVFVRQLEGVLRREDVVFALSVSGNSPNILKALEYAKQKGVVTIGCSGFDGGAMKALTDFNLHIQTKQGDYGPAEDLFGVVGHLIYSYLKQARKHQSQEL
jgi:D-sedoheptulose 7-phosphate isomerase